MFFKIKQLWNKHGFEILLGLSILFIIIFAILKKFKGEKGTWSKQEYYWIPDTNIRKPKKRIIRESRGETECRRVLEQIFNRRFDKSRPDFLRNPVTGGHFNLELDCFNRELRIAVEYNGIQHYKFTPYFHKNKEAFLNQKYRDQMKRQKCQQNGILLIEVPYTVKLENIKDFIINKMRNAGVKI